MRAFSDLMLVVALIGVSLLFALYLLVQPWWRSWFGISFVLMLMALVQTGFRGLMLVVLGEGYTGSGWVAFAGRFEFALGAWIAAIGLGRVLVRSYRAPGRTETPSGAPNPHSRVP